MPKTIRIPESLFHRLQEQAEPLVDKPASVIERILDHYEQCPSVQQHAQSAIEQSKSNPDIRLRSSHDIKHPALFLAPADRSNLAETVINAVPISRARPYLSATQYASIANALRNRSSFNCWAMTEGRRAYFEQMRPGDLVLFTPRSTGRFTYSGRVLLTLESERLGNALWPTRGTQPWELIYILEDIHEIDIPKSRVTRALGYNEGYVVPGIIRVSDEKLIPILTRFGSLKSFLDHLTDQHGEEIGPKQAE